MTSDVLDFCSMQAQLYKNRVFVASVLSCLCYFVFFAVETALYVEQYNNVNARDAFRNFATQLEILGSLKEIDSLAKSKDWLQKFMEKMENQFQKCQKKQLFSTHLSTNPPSRNLSENSNYDQRSKLQPFGIPYTCSIPLKLNPKKNQQNVSMPKHMDTEPPVEDETEKKSSSNGFAAEPAE